MLKYEINQKTQKGNLLPKYLLKGLNLKMIFHKFQKAPLSTTRYEIKVWQFN